MTNLNEVLNCKENEKIVYIVKEDDKDLYIFLNLQKAENFVNKRIDDYKINYLSSSTKLKILNDNMYEYRILCYGWYFNFFYYENNLKNFTIEEVKIMD